MKDQLKQHIDRNRKEFDVYQNDYHAIWKNIESKLDDTRHLGSGWVKYSLRIAASVVIIISLGISYYMGKKSALYQKEGLALHNISTEMAETEAYYIDLIDDQMNYINKNKTQVNEDIWESIQQLDNDYEQLKKDLAEQADSEEVIDAMIRYYRIKLEMLEKISEELKEKQAENEQVNI